MDEDRFSGFPPEMPQFSEGIDPDLAVGRWLLDEVAAP